MSVVILSGLGFAAGTVGVVLGTRRRTLSLDAVIERLTVDVAPGRSLGVGPQAKRSGRRQLSLAPSVAGLLQRRNVVSSRWTTRLALAGESLEEVCSRSLAWAGGAVVVPLLLWTGASAYGMGVPLLLPLWAALLVAAAAALVPVVQLKARAERAGRDARVVLCTFLDLVVLSLAGGMGIESALLTASQIGQSPLSRRMWVALSASRQTGEAPWDALGRLGLELGLDELCELAAAAALAGTEGARIRSTLVARAASIRRHMLAEAEADANTVTERLFLPGTLLLVGFLLFIGYPAFARITSGF